MPTSFQQNLRFRSVPEEPVEVFSFDGGLITDAHETKLKPNQSPNVANVIYNDTGSAKTRDGYLRYNGTPQGAAADQSNTGTSDGTTTVNDPGDYVAQTFLPSGAIEVTQVDIYLAMANSGEEQYVQVQLWHTSAGVPTELLTNGTGQVKLVSGTSETAYNFRFRVPVSLSAATTYAIVIRPYIRGSSQSVNEFNVYLDGASYANGSAYNSTDSGLNWTIDTNEDIKFVVYDGGDTAGTGLIRFYTTTGISQTIAKFGTSLYRGNDITGALTQITLGSGASLTSANFLDWTTANDTLLVVDDTNKILKYRGSTNANYSTGTITATNASATVTGSGTSWNTSTNAEVGEYIQLPDDKWYKITAIASDTSLTIERTYQGSTAAGETYTISPWGEVQGKLNSSSAPASLVVPTPKYIESHLNRIWTLDNNMLRFSVLDTSVTEEHFNDWDTSNNAGAIVIPSGQGDTGTGLYSLNGYLYIFQRNAIWELFGTSPNNFELRNISNEIGMIDKRTLVEYDRYLLFLSDKGLYLFDGVNLKNLSEGRVNSLINSWANKTSPAATLWDNKYVIAYTPSGETHNSEALFYDITGDVFGKIKGVYANLWNTWGGGPDTGQVLFISSNQGSIYHWGTGGHDDGYEIDTVYDTPSLGFGQGMNDKTVKKVYLQQIALGDWEMTASQFSDISTNEISKDISLSTGTSSLWDVMVWGVDSWASEGTLITERIAEFQGLAKYYKYRFEQSGYDEGMEILGLTVTARVRRLA